MGAGPPADFWSPDKHLLNVRFLNGTESEQNTVKSLIKKHYHSIPMRIRFNFLPHWDARPSDIRISFGDESKAYIGRQAEHHPGEPTMWLNMHPRLPAEAARKKVQGDVLHEFGHALGLTHEHKHPHRKARWNYTRLMEKYQWEYAKVHRNYDPNTASAAAAEWDRPYDPKSIMHYPIEKGDTQSMRAEVPDNYVLSDGDKEALAQIYPPVAVVRTKTYGEKKEEEERKSKSKESKKDGKGKHRQKIHVGGNRSAVVLGGYGGYVEVSGYGSATIMGNHVVTTGNGHALVYGDNMVYTSGNTSVYVNRRSSGMSVYIRR